VSEGGLGGCFCAIRVCNYLPTQIFNIFTKMPFMKPRLFWLLLFVLLPVVGMGQIITTVAGGGTVLGDGGQATASNLRVFGEIAIDSHGNIIIAANNDARVRKVDALTGIISTIGGTGTSGYSGDGGPATNAQFNWPNFAACDHFDNVYVSDHSHRIRKIDAITGIVSTIAGNGVPAFLGDGGPATAASINDPEGLVFDAHGNLFFADFANDRIRKISTTGIITTIAGTGLGGYSGDGGPATAAQIGSLWGIGIDNSGNLFFTDHGAYVRKIDLATGIINTVVGYGSVVYNGDGIPATSAGIGPVKMAFDVNNNMFIGDGYNNRIRMVDNAGIIRTVAGNGSAGYSGDGGPATAAQLYQPNGVEYFCGNVYIADAQNSRVRKIVYNTTSICPKLEIDKTPNEEYFIISPNPATTQITITTSPGLSKGEGKIKEVSVWNMVGQRVLTQQCNTLKTELNISALPAGVYFVVVCDEDGGRTISKIIKQ
jgi:trimeric autotransporter adhesin